MKRPRRTIPVLALAIALLTAFPAPPAGAQEPPESPSRPCVDDPRHRQLDFWLGEWRVVDGEGNVLGHNRITERHGGCVIFEEWTSARSETTGQSMNYVDPSDGRWRQVWVDRSGAVITYEAELRDGAMRFQGRMLAPDGAARLSRMVLEPLEEGRVRQRIEGSDDGGVTWTRDFEGFYLPVTEPLLEGGSAPAPAPETVPAPAPRATPAPAPAPRPAAPAPAPAPARGQVVAITDQVADEALAPEERPQVRLQSPAVLELPVGPVEALPRGYSWSTTETVPYLVEGASIRRVTLTRAESRGRSDLAVTVALHGDRYLQHAELTVELLSASEPVARAETGGFPLGRSLQAQHPERGLERDLTLSLDRETFERVFGGDERPVLRLTLAVRD